MGISDSLFRKASKGLLSNLREAGYKTPTELAAERGTPVIRAETQLTSAQWNRLLKRLLLDEPVAAQRGLLPERIASQTGEVGAPSPRVVDTLMGMEPPVTQDMTSLRQVIREPIGTAEFGPPKYMPQAAGREALLSNPADYMQGPLGPPIKQIQFTPPASPMPEDILNSISYKGINFNPALSSQETGSISKVLGGEKQEAAEGLLRGRGLTPEDIRVSPEEFLKGEGLQVKPEKTISDIMTSVVEAEQIWKEMGGARSVAGRIWKIRLEEAKGVQKVNKTPKDWFVTCYTKYKANPYNFSKSYPREANLLKQIESHGGE